MKRLKQFLKWMKGNKRYYFVAALILISLQYFRTLIPLFVQHTIDGVILGNDSNLPIFIQDLVMADTVQKQLLLVAIVYVLFALMRVLLMVIRRFINALYTERIAYNMRNTLYKKLQDLSFTYHSHVETGDLIQRCTTDVETYRVFVGEQLIEILRLGFLMGFSIYQMSGMSVRMTLISVVITPVIFSASFIYFILVKKVFKKVEEAEAKMTTTLQESVTGIRVVKAFAKEKVEIEKFNNHSEIYLKEDFKLLRLMAYFWGGTDFIIFIQYCLTLSLGIYFSVNGQL